GRGRAAGVSGTSGGDEKLKAAGEMGAIAAANYNAKGWEKALVAQAGRPPSLIIDSAGGDGLNALIAAAAPAARLLLYGATRFSPRRLDMPKIFSKHVDIPRTTLGTHDEVKHQPPRVPHP